MARQAQNHDKRSYPRIPKEVPIVVEKIQYPLPENSGEVGTAKDIACDGVCIRIPTPFEPGTLLSLKIDLQGWQRHKRSVSAIVDDSIATAPLTAIAKVVWLKKITDENAYYVGVKFNDVYEDDFNALKKYLDILFADGDNYKDNRVVS